MKSTTRPVKKKKGGLAAISPTYWLIGIVAMMVALMLIVLVSALTMRQWSEEQKIGTLEVLLTLPVRLHQLVLGKFLAVLALTSCALLLTLGLLLVAWVLGRIAVQGLARVLAGLPF